MWRGTPPQAARCGLQQRGRHPSSYTRAQCVRGAGTLGEAAWVRTPWLTRMPLARGCTALCLTPHPPHL